MAMKTRELVELAKRRSTRRILYFHTDHFEPWSDGPSDTALKALERFRVLSGKSRYGAKSSLFYSTYNPAILVEDDGGRGVSVPGDGVGFIGIETRDVANHRRISESIRAVAELGHEFHLHVHHEYWTQNSLDVENPIWHWVQERSNQELDSRRLELFVKLACESIAEESGRPFERWAFVHGNWALAGSDDQICRVEDEIPLLMRNGCFGDFTFPAGRSKLDPELRAPYVCDPVSGLRAYDGPGCQPRRIGFGTRVMDPGRFLVWSSTIRAAHSSIDWYHGANLKMLDEPQALVSRWLSESVQLADTLFLKTHAHSLNHRYELGESDNPIPHTHPAVTAAFDELMRVCDDVDIEFVPITVNELMGVLRSVDSSGRGVDDYVIKAAVDDALRGREAALEEVCEAPIPAAIRAAGLPGGLAGRAGLQDDLALTSEPMRSIQEFCYEGSHGLAMRPYGTVYKEHCPVCSCSDVRNIWKIPMARIDPPITVFGGYFNQIPILRPPFEVFGFDLCEGCESIFLNPMPTRESIISSYSSSSHYLTKMKNEDEWKGYRERYVDLVRNAPSGAESMIDAACGMGQILFLARSDSERGWRRLVGLELSEPYVRNMREEGIEAHVFDIDKSDPREHIESGSFDFVSFYEAFEHVERPLAALAKLLDTLRVGGRVCFSAQRYGDDVNLAVRPGEPIYIGPKVLEMIPELLPCSVVEVREAGARYMVTVERREGAITDVELGFGKGAEPQSGGPARRFTATPDGALDAGESLVLTAPFEREHGHAFVARLSRVSERLEDLGDTADNPKRSRIALYEDGEPLGPSHSAHAQIREIGQGRYSHWGKDLYFSSSDNSDPNRNTRVYSIRIDDA